MKTPTQKQYNSLQILGSGNMLISGIGGNRRVWTALIRNGWIAPEKPGEENGLRITADGHRALALAVERYGLGEINLKRQPKPEPPLVQRLREARDEARQERDEAKQETRHLEVRLGRAKRALEDVESW